MKMKTTEATHYRLILLSYFLQFLGLYCLSSTAVGCKPLSWSTTPSNPVAGVPFVLEAVISSFDKETEGVCSMTLKPNPEFEAWATDGLNITLPITGVMGADCITNRDTCTILPYLDGVAIPAHKHYNPPPSAVPPSTPLQYAVAYYAGSVEQVMDVKLQISFSLTANFNPGLPTSFVSGQQQDLVPSFSVSSAGPSSVRDGYCVVSITPLSVSSTFQVAF